MVESGELRMYFDPNTCQARIGLSVVEGKRYMFDNNGVMQSYAGTSVINGKNIGSVKMALYILAGWNLKGGKCISIRIPVKQLSECKISEGKIMPLIRMEFS